jgi:hypothetical protein
MHSNAQPPDMERLGRYARTPYGAVFIWCDFGLLTILPKAQVIEAAIFYILCLAVENRME